MRVCYFTNVYPTPSATTVRREIFALAALGVDVVRVAARPFKGALVEPADLAEAPKTRYLTRSIPYAAACLAVVAATRPIRLARAILDALKIGPRTKSGVWKHLMYLGEACVLLRITRNCAHIHANFGNAKGIAIMCRILGGPPVSLRIHGPYEFMDFTPPEWNWKVSHAVFVAPISEFGAQRIRALVEPRFHFKIKLLRCGVDINFLQSVDNSFSSLPAHHRLVCVARLEPEKGHDILMEAIAALRRNGLSVSVMIIGDGILRGRLLRHAQKLSISDAVEFVGWRSGDEVIDAMKSHVW